MAPTAAAVRAHPRWQKCRPSQDDARRIADALRALPGAMAGQFHNLDIKALSGARIKNLYRLRVGDYRIVYTVGGGEVLVLALQRRDETTYADLDRLAILRHGTGLKIVEVAPAAVAARADGGGPRAAPPPSPRGAREPADPVRPRRSCVRSASTATRSRPSGRCARASSSPRRWPSAGCPPRSWSWSATCGTTATATWRSSPTAARRRSTTPGSRRPSSPSASRAPEPDRRDRRARRARLRGGAGRLDRGVDVLPAPVAGAGRPPSGDRPVARARRPGHRQDGRRAAPGAPPGPRGARRARAADDVRERAAADVERAARALRARRRRRRSRRARSTASRCGSSPRATAPPRDPHRRRASRAAGGGDPHTPGPGRRARRHDRARPRVRHRARRPRHRLARGLPEPEAHGPRRGADRRASARRSGRATSATARRLAARRAVPTSRSCAYARSSSPRRAHGPRYDAIIVDEAQDLTETQVRLLMALDARADHRDLMFVGDGQQSIYPGGFTLRSVGLDVRGRSFLLRTNWRNTQAIAERRRGRHRRRPVRRSRGRRRAAGARGATAAAARRAARAAPRRIDDATATGPRRAARGGPRAGFARPTSPCSAARAGVAARRARAQALGVDPDA